MENIVEDNIEGNVLGSDSSIQEDKEVMEEIVARDDSMERLHYILFVKLWEIPKKCK